MKQRLQFVLCFAGMAAVTVGMWKLYEPFGWITGGVFALLTFAASLMETK
jgi:hypothetical protein